MLTILGPAKTIDTTPHGITNRHRIDNPERLKAFDEEGYYFHPHLSGEKEWLFCR